ncbi:hypothetical protein PF005_g3153 [Phytophthora fragariae]|uniref:RxLR effector protein n=1 Tax=Phytophthora fragariae TaxID=53985 RepID=A0A6A3FR48_9STRA|nr:hypothetical protein PF003_g28236 [Phytophthora fragariae]KAE8946956.1 hypothetical protein PF009_g3434 [Phytophthora fragariae]KAE9022714.1 hypothetical protein PF011_g4333 [Phytophthora fragariae]KAE9133905.1 hypothetical protein PF007_g3167 [Phytophthora fragariae]KAE9151130.1 hypothetical protein PF006_g4554 [Phytophthora fragariae]
MPVGKGAIVSLVFVSLLVCIPSWRDLAAVSSLLPRIPSRSNPPLLRPAQKLLCCVGSKGL